MVKFDVLKDFAHVPKWLHDTLNDPSTKNVPLSEFGPLLLVKKQEQVELDNVGLKGKDRDRIPKEISFLDTAIAMIYKYDLRNIMMTSDPNETLLGAYHTKGDKEGIYDTSNKHLRQLILQISPGYTNYLVNETLSKVEDIVPIVEQSTYSHIVPVNNGLFNKRTKELEPFTEERVYLSKIKTDYKKNVKNPTYTFADGVEWDVVSWIKEIGSNDPEIENLLWEVTSDFVQSNYTRNKSIFLYSEKGNNGKGTFGELLESLVGSNNISNLAIQDFKHEFLKESLIGKVGNIAHENDVDDYIDSVRDFKATVTGDSISINRKYEKAISYQFKGTNIQMFNGLPKTRDKSESFYRRILLVPFLQSFTNNGERTDIKNKFIHEKDVHEYVLNKALNLNFDEYTVPKISNDLLGKYKVENNPVLDFWEEFEDEFKWDLLPTGFIYDLYVSYYKRVNPTGKVMSKQSFLSQLRTNLNAQDSDWIDRTDRNSKVRTSSKMDADEPLITEYNLVNWMDTTYKGKDLTKLRDFKRKGTYRGFMRD